MDPATWGLFPNYLCTYMLVCTAPARSPCRPGRLVVQPYGPPHREIVRGRGGGVGVGCVPGGKRRDGGGLDPWPLNHRPSSCANAPIIPSIVTPATAIFTKYRGQKQGRTAGSSFQFPAVGLQASLSRDQRRRILGKGEGGTNTANALLETHNTPQGGGLN